MGFFRIIIYSLLFYIIYRIVKTLFQLISKPKQNKSEPYVKTDSSANSKINSKDIIDVEFEEIKISKSEEPNGKQD